MKKKAISIGIAVLIVLGAFVVVKALPAKEVQGADHTEKELGMLVEVMYAQLGTVQPSFKATGKLTAFDRLEMYAQVEGQLLTSARNFKEGKSYAKGEVMLEIDQREYGMTVLAQKSDFITLITSVLPDLKSDYPDAYNVWRKYVSSIDVKEKLSELPEVSTEQLKFYLAGKGVFSNYYTILSAEEKLAKYTFVAPFDGVVTSAVVEAGTAVRSGSELGTMINTSAYDLEITVPLSLLGSVKVGTQAILTSSDLSGQWQGKVVRIGGDIDEQTQSVKLFIRTSGQNLKEGMYLTAELEQKPFDNAMSIPRKMLDDSNRVFIVDNGTLKQKELHVLSLQDDVAIVEGIDEGTPLLSTVIKSAYDGMKVRIAN
jgi:multidrug efflux pump subunit AcrA (membrane-fusion protein)